MNEGKDCVNFMESRSDHESPADFSVLEKVQFRARGMEQ